MPCIQLFLFLVYLGQILKINFSAWTWTASHSFQFASFSCYLLYQCAQLPMHPDCKPVHKRNLQCDGMITSVFLFLQCVNRGPDVLLHINHKQGRKRHNQKLPQSLHVQKTWTKPANAWETTSKNNFRSFRILTTGETFRWGEFQCDPSYSADVHYMFARVMLSIKSRGGGLFLVHHKPNILMIEI